MLHVLQKLDSAMIMWLTLTLSKIVNESLLQSSLSLFQIVVLGVVQFASSFVSLQCFSSREMYLHCYCFTQSHMCVFPRNFAFLTEKIKHMGLRLCWCSQYFVSNS